MVLTMQLGRRDIILAKGHHSGQGANNTQLACSTGANVLVMVLQGCKSIPQKSISQIWCVDSN